MRLPFGVGLAGSLRSLVNVPTVARRASLRRGRFGPARKHLNRGSWAPEPTGCLVDNLRSLMIPYGP